MSTLERLKILYEERHRENFDIEVWDNAIEAAWPKLLAVAEAAEEYFKDESGEFNPKYFPKRFAVQKALAALHES